VEDEVNALIFDISRFDLYREDNRREVKKARGGIATFFVGHLLSILQIVMVESLSLV